MVNFKIKATGIRPEYKNAVQDCVFERRGVSVCRYFIQHEFQKICRIFKKVTLIEIERSEKTKAFTLVEIMIALAIVAILTAISLPILFSSIEKQMAQGALPILHQIRELKYECQLEGLGHCDEWQHTVMVDGKSVQVGLIMTDPSDGHFTYATDVSATNSRGKIWIENNEIKTSGIYEGVI